VDKKVMKKQRNQRFGFTLVELIIVVSILGILAAIVLPEFQNHSKLAKEAQAKANLRTLREAIERYAADHNGIPPGYSNNDPTATASPIAFSNQIKPYLGDVTNPFNSKYTVQIYQNNQILPASATGNYGWLYKPSTKEIRLDYPGMDSEGKTFFSY
jgi:general secretion pathway protein G